MPDSVRDDSSARPRRAFPRSVRLRRPAQYRWVFDHPIRSANRSFTVLARLNSLDYARLGLAVSRKTAQRAVARNRLKRLIRESFRDHQAGLPCYDIVVIARPASQQVDALQLRAALLWHWQRLKVSNKDKRHRG